MIPTFTLYSQSVFTSLHNNYITRKPEIMLREQLPTVLSKFSDFLQKLFW